MSANQSDLTTFGSEAVPEDACVRYEICGRTVPENGRICGPCLDELRANDREHEGNTHP
jgi:hypothetical protein